MKKIMIVGSGGAGKSTFAQELGERTNIPVHHLDRIFWKKNWVNITREELIEHQQLILQENSWIIDGNYSSTMDVRLDAADTIVFLDLPRMQCLYRVVKRRMMYHKQVRPDMAEGCEEKLDLAFLKWVWNYPKRARPKLLARLQEMEADRHVIILRSSRDVRTFLNNIV